VIYQNEFVTYTRNEPKAFLWLCRHEVFHKLHDWGEIREHIWMKRMGTPHYKICDRLTVLVFGKMPTM
jgi:hypothetical protein